MGSIVKVIVGVVIGALVFWLVQSQFGYAQTERSKQSTETDNGYTEGALADHKKSEDTPFNQQVSGESLSVERQLRRVEAELARVTQELNRVQNANKTSHSSEMIAKKTPLSTSAIQNSDQPNSDDGKQSDYLAGISEDYHQLLDPPKRRKDLPELHEDFVDEEEDLSWALAMEQQIRNFKENHANSGYVLDFSIQCKATMCEMFAKVNTEFTKQWDELNNDMVAQGWWEFSGTSSSGTTIADGSIYINVRLLQRKTS